MAQINAAVAVILDEHKDKVYISLRQKFQTYSDYWEFPGGKLEKTRLLKNVLKGKLMRKLVLQLIMSNLT
ncbi:putative mutator protein [Francisella tularensis subsp. tularensis]|nr:putative mutator protein [Francisella tularensis subsp. tularensis]AKU73700.1 putative mutator protein [Francisella tularensis subsp. tularensis]KFJ64135.1 hypothetical protein DR81_1587 [Francisella tularensis]